MQTKLLQDLIKNLLKNLITHLLSDKKKTTIKNIN